MTQDSLEQIHSEINSCKKCALGDSCTNHVPGQGNSNANIIFIGEAPGKNEDLSGKPFCGRAGEVLDLLLKVAGYRRDDIYITNILKCRPPKNRDPKPSEIKICTRHLIRQLKALKPKIIGCLGNFATAFIMNNFRLREKANSIGQIHGKIFIPPGSSLKVVPLYHPASAVYNPNMAGMLKKDFAMLKNIPV